MAFVHVLIAMCFQSALSEWELMFAPNAVGDEIPLTVGGSLGDCQTSGTTCSGCGNAWIEYSPSLKWCYGSSTGATNIPPLDPDNGKQYGKQVWFNGDCSVVNPPLCQCVQGVSGRWVNIQSSPDPSHISVTVGVQRSYSVDITANWGAKVTASVQAGFSAFGLSGSTTVTGETSISIGAASTKTFQETDTVTQTFDFGPGMVWQWQFTTTTSCGKASVLTTNFAVTPGLYQPPCCLPGYALNISSYQKCHAASDGHVYNLCSAEDLQVHV